MRERRSGTEGEERSNKCESARVRWATSENGNECEREVASTRERLGVGDIETLFNESVRQ